MPTKRIEKIIAMLVALSVEIDELKRENELLTRRRRFAVVDQRFDRAKNRLDRSLIKLVQKPK